MARARSGKRKKAKKKRTTAPAQAPRRRRAPRVKAPRGPVQLWLPLQMPLGLLGGVALAPAPVDGDSDPDRTGEGALEASTASASLGVQEPLFG